MFYRYRTIRALDSLFGKKKFSNDDLRDINESIDWAKAHKLSPCEAAAHYVEQTMLVASRWEHERNETLEKSRIFMLEIQWVKAMDDGRLSPSNVYRVATLYASIRGASMNDAANFSSANVGAWLEAGLLHTNNTRVGDVGLLNALADKFERSAPTGRTAEEREAYRRVRRDEHSKGIEFLFEMIKAPAGQGDVALGKLREHINQGRG